MKISILMVRYIASVAIICASIPSFADHPPSLNEFFVRSKTALYIAQIKFVETNPNNEAVKGMFRLFVQRIESSGASLPYWEAQYLHPGYSSGLLSNDGEYFAYVAQWYLRDKPAVQIYHRGARCALTGEQLGMDGSKLKRRSVSHRLWLTGEASFVEIDGKAVALRVPSEQGDLRIGLKPVMGFRQATCVSDK